MPNGIFNIKYIYINMKLFKLGDVALSLTVLFSCSESTASTSTTTKSDFKDGNYEKEKESKYVKLDSTYEVRTIKPYTNNALHAKNIICFGIILIGMNKIKISCHGNKRHNDRNAHCFDYGYNYRK